MSRLGVPLGIGACLALFVVGGAIGYAVKPTFLGALAGWFAAAAPLSIFLILNLLWTGWRAESRTALCDSR